MTERRKSIHGSWSGRLAFILAATGSAVGLGNIWKFPYIAGENGGGAFVLVYLVCVIVIGRPPAALGIALAQEAGAHRLWSWLGGAGVAAGFLILSYYSVIAGWALAYVFRSAAGTFSGATAEGIASIFGQLTGDPERLRFIETVARNRGADLTLFTEEAEALAWLAAGGSGVYSVA